MRTVVTNFALQAFLSKFGRPAKTALTAACAFGLLFPAVERAEAMPLAAPKMEAAKSQNNSDVHKVRITKSGSRPGVLHDKSPNRKQVIVNGRRVPKTVSAAPTGPKRKAHRSGVVYDKHPNTKQVIVNGRRIPQRVNNGPQNRDHRVTTSTTTRDHRTMTSSTATRSDGRTVTMRDHRSK